MTHSLTAVVNSFRHFDYVWNALESVLSQQAPEPFEILLLSPSPGLEMPHRLLEISRARDRPVRRVLVPNRPIGHALLAALDATSGDYLAILDDDDLWDPRKLQVVQTVLKSEPELAFLHNGQSLVDEHDQGLSALGPHRLIRQSSSRSRPGRAMTVDPGSPVSFAAGREYSPDVNNSSITIRRSVLEGIRDILPEVRVGEDTFLYYAAIATGNRLWVTSDRLTRYRVHRRGFTRAVPMTGERSEPWAAYRALVEQHLESLRLLRERVFTSPAEWIDESLRNDEAFWSALGGVAGFDSLQGKRSAAVSQLLGQRWLRPRSRDFFAATLAAASLLAPNVSRRAFALWRELWF